jgi:predicted TIM-barrel fold metal-dependent hydrolase
MKPLAGAAARRLVRPVLPAELEPILVHPGVGQTVLVQAAVDGAEADFLLSLAERHAFIAGAVVGSAPGDARRARRFPKLRAVIDHIAKPDIARRAHEPWAGLRSG